MTPILKNGFMEIRAAAGKPSIGEMYIYNYISAVEFWGDEVTPQSVKDALDRLGNITHLHIYINSPGGDVFAGHTIYNILNRHPAEKIVHIDGVAASIATELAMVGKRIIMPKNTFMMIHHAFRGAIGNAAQLRKAADDLERINESIIALYLERTGMDRDTLIAMLDAETWLSAQECVDLGFADEVEGTVQVAAALTGDTLAIAGATFDLSQFRNRPRVEASAQSEEPSAVAPEIQAAGRIPSSENEGHIRSAHEALTRVLDKLGTGSEEEPPAEEPPSNSTEPPAAEPPPDDDAKAQAMAHLQTLRAQIETKRLR